MPADATYRKYTELGGWSAFIENANDQLLTAPGQAGACLGVGDSQYVVGLVG